MATETMNLHSYFQAFSYLDMGVSATLSVLMIMISLGAALVMLKLMKKDW